MKQIQNSTIKTNADSNYYFFKPSMPKPNYAVGYDISSVRM